MSPDLKNTGRSGVLLSSDVHATTHVLLAYYKSLAGTAVARISSSCDRGACMTCSAYGMYQSPHKK